MLPLVLCDTMGLESLPDTGLDMEDLYSIYRGHIQDRYQVNHARETTITEQRHDYAYYVGTWLWSLKWVAGSVPRVSSELSVKASLPEQDRHLTLTDPRERELAWWTPPSVYERVNARH